MAQIKYTRSIAALSWIDPLTGLPEIDRIPPGSSIDKNAVTARNGYRFAHLLEVWVNYDDQARTIIGHGFTSDSGIYGALSYGGIPSEEYTRLIKVRVGREPIVFTQIVGARTRSPEVIGGSIWGPGGNIAANAVSGFPPIWTELELSIYNDGHFEGQLLRHSIFPSVSFYKNDLNAQGMPTNNFTRSNNYNAVPNLDWWKREGWGKWRGESSGPIAGNPWDITDSIFNGIDSSSPFGWL